MNDSIISFYWNNSSDFLRFNSETLYLEIGSKNYQVPFSNLISFKLDSKKKLAPLIIGAVITSLALVNILIEGAGLSMIGFLSIGLLILYFGLSDYWVISIEQISESTTIWISKNKCPQFSLTLINIIDFRISKQGFPPFYAYVKKDMINNVISNSNLVENLIEPVVYYLIPPKPDPAYVLIKIDITKITAPIEFVVNQPHLAEGRHKINNAALMNIEV